MKKEGWLVVIALAVVVLAVIGWFVLDVGSDDAGLSPIGVPRLPPSGAVIKECDYDARYDCIHRPGSCWDIDTECDEMQLILIDGRFEPGWCPVVDCSSRYPVGSVGYNQCRSQNDICQNLQTICNNLVNSCISLCNSESGCGSPRL